MLPKSPKTSEDIIQAYKSQHVKANYGISLQNQTDDDTLPSTEFLKTAYKSKCLRDICFIVITIKFHEFMYKIILKTLWW